MEFEEMKKIWDTQKGENIYTFSEQALHVKVTQKCFRINRKIKLTHWFMLITVMALAVVLTVDGILGNEYFQFIESGVLVIVIGYLYWDWRKGLKYAGLSDGSILADIRQSIKAIEYYVKRQKNSIWWFILPLVINGMIHHYFTDVRPLWKTPLMIVLYCIFYWSVIKETNKKDLPEKKDLETLKKLLESDETIDKVKTS
jgi:hypothetical protein